MTLPSRLRFLLPGLLAAGIAAAWAQPPQAVPPGLPSGSAQAPASAAAPRVAQAQRQESHPTWSELNPQQQQSLAPLAASWRSLGEAHKRKWIALCEHYPTMPPAEQAKLHSRMAEWAALSPRQRTLARMNYAQTQAVPSDDKRAKWEAYQALSPEEKRRLAAGAETKPVPPATAAAVQPVPEQKLTRLPRPRKAEAGNRIPMATGRVDQNTLLPRPAAPAPVRAAPPARPASAAASAAAPGVPAAPPAALPASSAASRP